MALLLKKVSQCTSTWYCNTPSICTTALLVSLRSEEREYCQYSSHLYRGTPPICIALRLPFVSQCFWESPDGCGHGDVLPSHHSGKEKAHKHKSFRPVTPPVTLGSPDLEARSRSFMCYPRSPRNINLFVRIPDREDR